MKGLRCNNCYSKSDVAKEPFTLTKCGHVYCTRCIIEAERQCPICNAVNVPAIQLQEPLESKILSYFTPLRDQLPQLIAVANFQDEQTRIIIKRLNDLDPKYLYCKEVCRKLEIAASQLHKKCKINKEFYMKKICSLERENARLKAALDKEQNNSYGNFQGNQSNASSSLKQHTCNKRFQQNVLFPTPSSIITNISSAASSQFDRKYLSSRVSPKGIFQIPNTSKVLRSAGTRSSTSTASTPLSLKPGHLGFNSLAI